MKVTDGSHLPEKERKELEELVMEDIEKWEKGDYGKNSQTIKKVPPEKATVLRQAIVGESELKPISIKMPPVLIEALKELASEDHIGYQTYIKQILSRHVRKEQLKRHQA